MTVGLLGAAVALAAVTLVDDAVPAGVLLALAGASGAVAALAAVLALHRLTEPARGAGGARTDTDPGQLDVCLSTTAPQNARTRP